MLEFPDEQEQEGEEGCLSFPGVYYDAKRRLNTVASGFTDQGDPVQVVGTEVLARCLQHETDHLDGVLFIDRMDAATRKRAMREIRDANWDGPVKISPHRMTDRIFGTCSGAHALPHRLRRKRSNQLKCGYRLLAIHLSHVR